MVTLKPEGRGNWTPVALTVDGRHAAPLTVRVGDRLVLGGVTFRVCGVSA